MGPLWAMASGMWLEQVRGCISVPVGISQRVMGRPHALTHPIPMLTIYFTVIDSRRVFLSQMLWEFVFLVFSFILNNSSRNMSGYMSVERGYV